MVLLLYAQFVIYFSLYRYIIPLLMLGLSDLRRTSFKTERCLWCNHGFITKREVQEHYKQRLDFSHGRRKSPTLNQPYSCFAFLSLLYLFIAFCLFFYLFDLSFRSHFLVLCCF